MVGLLFEICIVDASIFTARLKDLDSFWVCPVLSGAGGCGECVMF